MSPHLAYCAAQGVALAGMVFFNAPTWAFCLFVAIDIGIGWATMQIVKALQ